MKNAMQVRTPKPVHIQGVISNPIKLACSIYMKQERLQQKLDLMPPVFAMICYDEIKRAYQMGAKQERYNNRVVEVGGYD